VREEDVREEDVREEDVREEDVREEERGWFLAQLPTVPWRRFVAIRKPSSRRRYWNAHNRAELSEEQEIVSCVERVTVTPTITERVPTNVGQSLGNF